jgi:hypothetical protein
MNPPMAAKRNGLSLFRMEDPCTSLRISSIPKDGRGDGALYVVKKAVDFPENPTGL